MPKKQAIPAVFFQKRLNGVTDVKTTPERLVLFEEQLAMVTGGSIAVQTTCYDDRGQVVIDD